MPRISVRFAAALSVAAMLWTATLANPSAPVFAARTASIHALA